MALKASIDIGTNSTRLLIVDDRAGRINVIEGHERITRLGDDLSPLGELAPASMQRVLTALQEYRRVIDAHGIDDVRVMATSATRDAPNRDSFLHLILATTGWRCRVLSGAEEARLSFLGAISDLQHARDVLVCDIGGGSTEFIFAHDRTMQSLDIGSSRLTKQFLLSDPPTKDKIDALIEFTQQQLQSSFGKKSALDIVAVGGTAVTLALMDAETPLHDAGTAHHHLLTRVRLGRMIDTLSRARIAERAAIVGLHPRRADVILAGALILSVILDFFACESTLISVRDLLYGIFFEERLRN
ncbi:Ppx/GppA family phosphatase [candidate division KSB1 bacterium]|nr:Ppx/GppA family phosphatase [candidate division KSB1 bacterium]RQW01651.1 MAG: Ppx/GppA family phosphatase [candidate division KSB1 bacterium]